MSSRVRVWGRFLVGLWLGLSPLAANAATLLPNGEQTFVDPNGVPYAAGKVYFYVPGTLTAKTTWSNPGATVANANPVVLDSAGRAVIYGVGSYREILKDVFGNTIWDQLTQGLGSGGQVVNPVITGGGTITACSGVFPINNTSTAPITLTMPSSPSDGDSCTFLDVGDNSGTFVVTLALGSNLLNLGGNAAYLNSNGMALTLIWSASAGSWTQE